MFRALGAEYLLPIHHSTFRLSREPVGEPRAAAARRGRERAVARGHHRGRGRPGRCRPDRRDTGLLKSATRHERRDPLDRSGYGLRRSDLPQHSGWCRVGGRQARHPVRDRASARTRSSVALASAAASRARPRIAEAIAGVGRTPTRRRAELAAMASPSSRRDRLIGAGELTCRRYPLDDPGRAGTLAPCERMRRRIQT